MFTKKISVYISVGVVSLFFAFILSSTAHALPSNLKKIQLVSGLNTPTAFAPTPDGRIFILEKGGFIKVYKNGAILPTPLMSLGVNFDGERGLLGIALDPNFASNGYFYVYYTNLNPLEDRVSRFTAVGDTADPGSEQMLLHSTLPLGLIHHSGTVRIGPDGKLWISVGDNSNAVNSQDLSNIHGKILRINLDGSVPTDNPFFGQAGRRPEIWAYGLRNPFRFNFLPDGRPIIGDVGGDLWEEINIGVKGGNYGWPNQEGPCSSSCPYVNPVFAYQHNGKSAAVVGGFFSNGTYLYGDYAQGFIRKIQFDNQLNFLSDSDFDPDAGTVVDLEPNGTGDILYLTIFPGALYRITASTDNLPPEAKITANPQGGPTPLTVSFSSDGSSDPQRKPLSYKWDFGDGTTSTEQNPSHTYSQNSTYTASLVVNDGQLDSQPATTNVIAGHHIPTVFIIAPWSGKYNAGDKINFGAFAYDVEDGFLPPSAYSWTIIFHHQTHIHPFLGPISGPSGSFTIPQTGESSTQTSYEIILTVTDSVGLKKTVSKTIFPNIVNLTVNSSPVQGLGLTLDGIPQTTSLTIPTVVGFKRTLNIPSPHQTIGNLHYSFDSWSDNQTLSHDVTTPAQDTTYTANFIETPAGQGKLRLRVRQVDPQGNPTNQYINGAVAKLTDISGTVVYQQATSASQNNEDGWILFNQVDSGVYSLLVYGSGYTGPGTQNTCGGNGTVADGSIANNNTDGFTAAIQRKITISPDSTVTCQDISLQRNNKGGLYLKTRVVKKDPTDTTGTQYFPAGSLNGVTVKLTDTNGVTVYQTAQSAPSPDGQDGWVYFKDLPEGTYGLMAYKPGYNGFWKQTGCNLETDFQVHASITNQNTEGQQAAWNNSVVVSGGRINYCHDLGLLDPRPPSPTPTPACHKDQGDANCDGRTDLVDFEIWRREYVGELISKTADFNSDGKVDLIDFEIWRKTFAP